MILSCGNKKLKFTVLGNPENLSPCYAERLLVAAGEAIKEQHWKMPHKDMPVELFITAYQETPKGVAKWKKEAATHNLIPPLKPIYDWRALSDCTELVLAKLAYESSDQIFKLHWELQYGEPRVEVELIAYYTDIGDIKAEVVKRNKGLVNSK